jgi:hypothetical protein
MAAPPPISSLQLEGMLDAEGGIDPQKLVSALNQFIGGTHTALSKQLSFGDNFPATVKEVRVTMPSAPPWREVGTTGNPAFENSWVNYDTTYNSAAFLMEPGGFVRIKGFVKNGALSTDIIFTLPVGYRPPRNFRFATAQAAGFGMLDVLSTGTVACIVGSTVNESIDSASFYATTPANPDAFTSAGWPLMVAHDLTECTGLVVLACTQSGLKRAQSIGAPYVDWEDAGDGRVRIRSVWGLAWGASFTLRLLMLSE